MRLFSGFLLVLAVMVAGPVHGVRAQSGPVQNGDDRNSYRIEREAMVAWLAEEARLTAAATGVETISAAVLDAMRAVPRHAFVPEILRPYAYAPYPLPIHPEQNLAAPFLVALMTELAAIKPDDRIFETGTGAGYHAAIMARLGAEVFSVELIPELAGSAQAALKVQGVANAHVRQGDGYFGWREESPFDVIVIKEAIDVVPSPLLAQLAPDGRIVAPLGPSDGPQFLTVLTRRADGSLRERRYLPVRFSPLQGGERI